MLQLGNSVSLKITYLYLSKKTEMNNMIKRMCYQFPATMES